jgi:DinB family
MQSTSKKAISALAVEYIRELESEVQATSDCLKVVPMDKPAWKPHEKSMPLGYLAILTADIPRWIQYAIEKGEVDFATYEQANAETAEELVAHFEKSVDAAKRALENVSDERLKETFYLKQDGKELFSSPIDETIMQSINHLVHHRGQLTVYLRLNDIAVPSIYGPSADSPGF